MRNIDDVLKQIKEVLRQDEECEEILVIIENIEYSLKFKAPECMWDYVYIELIELFIPPKTETDYKVLSIWTGKSVEELKGE